MQALFVIGAIAMAALLFYMIRSGRIRFRKGDVGNSAFTLGILALFILLVIYICMRVLHIST